MNKRKKDFKKVEFKLRKHRYYVIVPMFTIMTVIITMMNTSFINEFQCNICPYYQSYLLYPPKYIYLIIYLPYMSLIFFLLCVNLLFLSSICTRKIQLTHYISSSFSFNFFFSLVIIMIIIMYLFFFIFLKVLICTY